MSDPGEHLLLPAPEATTQGWHRLDPRMLLVHPVRELLRFLPALLAIFVAGRASGGAPWELLGVAAAIGLGLLRYLTTSFRIAGGRVELRRGLLNRHVLSTPLDRVRTVDVTASPIHRVLGLTTLRIGTGTSASSEDQELDLDGLRIEEARRLRAGLLDMSGADEDPVDATSPAGDATVVGLELAWLRYAPLTSSGLVVTAGLLGVGTQLLSTLQVGVEVNPEAVRLGLPGWSVAVAAFLGVVVVVAAVALAGYLVTNWGFALTRGRGAWHLRRGLFTTHETSLDEARVAGVTLHEPLGLRLAGAGRLSAIVTGLDRDQSGGSTLVPPAPRGVLVEVAGVVLGSDAPPVAPLVPHGPAARRRRWSRALVPALALAVTGGAASAFDGGPWWSYALLLLLPLAAAALAADRSRALGHALAQGYVVAQSGSLARRRDHLDVDDIIGWNLRATWSQRRVGLTSLVATMSGGRQSVTVLDVPEPLAVALADAGLPHVVGQFLEPGPVRTSPGRPIAGPQQMP